jgi:tetraacyldisaccharide 4'-kinase
MLAQWAVSRGYRVAVLSRGYKGSNKQKVLTVSDGKRLLADSDSAGDEPVLLANRLPEVPVIVSKRRYEGGIWAHHQYQTNFFILDDGFQHRALRRDLDLVLLDEAKPFGNCYLLPRGPLREPVSALKRAQVLVMTRCRGDLSLSPWEDLPGWARMKPIFRSTHVPEKIVFPLHNHTHPPGFLAGKRVIAFSGIGRPESFKEMLLQLGADIIALKCFGDHHQYSPEEVKRLMTMYKEMKGDLIITTEKDWVRLAGLKCDCPQIAYLTIAFTIPDNEENFFKTIEDNIHHGS